MTGQQADVLVVGAGPAGTTAARLLARSGWDVLLVDRAEFPRPKTCGDGLTPRAVATLQRLELLQPLLELGYPRIEGALVVSPAGLTWRAAFAEYGHGLPAFGLMAPREELDDWLRRQAMEAGARFLGRVQALDVRRDNGRMSGIVAQHDGRPLTLTARLTIVATGVGLTLPRALGLLPKMPPVVRAVRAYYEGVEGLGSDFEFHFPRQLHPGYAWVFPAGDGRANVGVGLFPSDRPNRGNHPGQWLEWWLGQPAQAARFGRAHLLGAARSYPLRADYPLHAVSGPGFLVAGEAAGLVNPITGEGIDLALESGEIAARVADAALRRGDLSARRLSAYGRALGRRFGQHFRWLHALGPTVMRPRALDILVAKGARWPALGRSITGIIMGTRSPAVVLNPLTWFYLFF